MSSLVACRSETHTGNAQTKNGLKKEEEEEEEKEEKEEKNRTLL